LWLEPRDDPDSYIKMSGGISKGKSAITIDESLPVVSLCSKPYDKSCFGVISSAEDEFERTDTTGNIVSVFC